MKRSRSGSNQTDVPVKPVCPNAFGHIFVPALEFSDGVSQPGARDEPGGIFWRVINARTRLADSLGSGNARCEPRGGAPCRLSSSQVANLRKSRPVLKNPAC